MKKTKIKGKDYIEVNERLKYFRDKYGEDWALVSEIISHDDDVIVMKASIVDPQNVVIATGHAHEKEGSNYINKTSYVENCETSAWGRALANFGIGIDTSVASADEVENAIENQDKKPAKKPTTKKPGKVTDAHIKKIIASGQEFDSALTKNEIAAVANWYWENNDHGGRTAEAAQALIHGFPTIFTRFQEAR